MLGSYSRTPQATLHRAAALDWLLTLKGTTLPIKRSSMVGHDTNLAGGLGSKEHIPGSNPLVWQCWLSPLVIGQAKHPRLRL